MELTFVARLVAEEEIQRAAGVGEVPDGEGGARRRVVDRDGVVHGGREFDLERDAGGFHGPDALFPPPRRDHFFDQRALGGSAGLVLFHEVVVLLAKVLGHFAWENHGAAEEAVARGVERRVVFAAGGDRAAGFGAVGARGGGTGFGSGTFGSHVAPIVNYEKKEIGDENGEVIEKLGS